MHTLPHFQYKLLSHTSIAKTLVLVTTKSTIITSNLILLPNSIALLFDMWCDQPVEKREKNDSENYVKSNISTQTWHWDSALRLGTKNWHWGSAEALLRLCLWWFWQLRQLGWLWQLWWLFMITLTSLTFLMTLMVLTTSTNITLTIWIPIRIIEIVLP